MSSATGAPANTIVIGGNQPDVTYLNIVRNTITALDGLLRVLVFCSTFAMFRAGVFGVRIFP